LPAVDVVEEPFDAYSCVWAVQSSSPMPRE
jgi:hypothetical protein